MRLIDAHALYREYQEKVCDGIACHECKATNEDGTCKLDLFISTAPTIDIEERLNDAYAHGWSDAEAKYHDAVDVVRCRDCKHMYRTIFAGSIYNNCGKRTEHVEPDGYCEQGER